MRTQAQVEVVLVAVRLDVEICRNFLEPFVAVAFDVLLHESVIGAPRDPCGTYGSLLGAGRDLVSVKVVQAEPVNQRLLDCLMQQQKAIGLNDASTEEQGEGPHCHSEYPPSCTADRRLRAQ